EADLSSWAFCFLAAPRCYACLVSGRHTRRLPGLVEPIGRKLTATMSGGRGTHATTKSDCRSPWRLARQGTCPRFASLGRRGGRRSGCFSIRHSSRLWLPTRLDSHGLSRGSVSRAGHAPGGPGQTRARYPYGHTHCGLNRKRQSLGQWSERLCREIRPCGSLSTRTRDN